MKYTIIYQERVGNNSSMMSTVIKYEHVEGNLKELLMDRFDIWFVFPGHQEPVK